MPNTYKRTGFEKPYKNYTPETLEDALLQVREGKISLNKAAKEFNISRSTLQNKIKKLHTKSVGGPTALLEDEEACIVKMLLTTSNWGFPLATLDLRHITKRFRDRKGKRVSKLNNNFSGKDWAHSFLERHKDQITPRICQNITPARAAISVSTMSSYFNNLENSLEGIPPENISNYDETNFTDDPGSKKAIFSRGVKYPEQVMAHSKSSISLMFCSTATGQLLPVYVVYKAKNVYKNWMEGDRPGSRYNATSHGWFDNRVFSDWFQTIYLPYARRLTGPKAIIGDNLSSHFSEDVIKLAEENNIKFICLPPNCIHIAQPLDVAFFRPLKILWRKTLTEYKIANSKNKTVPKDVFPSLLKKVWDSLHENDKARENLISGFRATGIYPCDRQQVLSKLDKTESRTNNTTSNMMNLSDSVLDYMKRLRTPDTSTRKPRKKKVNTEPGASVTMADFTLSSSVLTHSHNVDAPDDATEEMSTDQPGPSKISHRRKPRRRKARIYFIILLMK
ncbi:uncharacterized protein LOC129906661 [Episyrphus balteatus]|uniref:uncharacterized protein LOC129906661 n=1 Tax=Episyrphus balteatus TaxID=286459 RepID=UPI002485E547|nr:uncharacterized protein LOC129906661 [Episyrphus balteatus]